ncbi:Palmitoyltransferase [Hexamita inflata]|uniref:Palmitoyltransferase n=1 Tax=Hexamita inflata TaxID=28002 RepID=A0AA86UP65_9EUKA|nr:Palmitoyltransferase [Hexamita inflata]
MSTIAEMNYAKQYGPPKSSNIFLLSVIFTQFFHVSLQLSGFYTIASYIFSKSLNHSKSFQLILFTVFTYLLISYYSSWYQTARTDPGHVKIVTSQFQVSQESGLWCKKCSTLRPARSHHCKYCKKCIENFDHHCVWALNCVGRRNKCYFYKFVVFTLIDSVWAAVCARKMPYISKFRKICNYFPVLFSVTMVIQHTAQICMDQTSIEARAEKLKMHGTSVRNNVHAVLSKNWLSFILIPGKQIKYPNLLLNENLC